MNNLLRTIAVAMVLAFATSPLAYAQKFTMPSNYQIVVEFDNQTDTNLKITPSALQGCAQWDFPRTIHLKKQSSQQFSGDLSHCNLALMQFSANFEVKAKGQTASFLFGCSVTEGGCATNRFGFPINIKEPIYFNTYGPTPAWGFVFSNQQ